MATTKIKKDAGTTVQKTAGKAVVTPIQLNRIAQDALTRKQAVAEAERAYFPYRYLMQQMFLNTADNGHIKSCINRRKDLTLLRKFELKSAGGVDDETTMLFCNVKDGNLVPKTWFTNFISHALDTPYYGYTLIELNDIINGEFPKLGVVKRWNVSPDRFCVMSFPYMVYGANFMIDEEIKDWYLYIDTPNDIGTSPCGYGILWDVSVQEIFLRNLLGFNGSFVELFSQPFRWGKTTKTNEDERAAFADMLQRLGSSGWGMGDPEDDVEFKETALGGTGYKGYDNLESRLEKVVSKLILGHSAAMDQTPGKLGSGGFSDSPEGNALRDKQTKDGNFIENIINDLLIPKMRNLGFAIPLDCAFSFKNDAEVMDAANNIVDLAVKMKTAGIPMDGKYFTEQTGIPVAEPAPMPGPGLLKPITKQPAVAARLKSLYAHKHVHV